MEARKSGEGPESWVAAPPSRLVGVRFWAKTLLAAPTPLLVRVRTTVKVWPRLSCSELGTMRQPACSWAALKTLTKGLVALLEVRPTAVLPSKAKATPEKLTLPALEPEKV